MTAYTATLTQRLALLAYSSAVWLLVIPIQTVRYWLSVATRSPVRLRLRQRLGYLPKGLKNNAVLFHCVSVGEVVAASCVINALRNSRPDIDIVISTTTATGKERVNTMLGDDITHVYLPYDTPYRMRRWLARLNPRAVVITEVELWPHLIDCCWKRDIPVAVINARMTDRSAHRYQKLSALFAPMLAKLTHVCAQGERDYQNYLSLGMDEQRLTLTHNVKFDQVASLMQTASASFAGLNAGERRVIVGGSTHEPEETALLDALIQCQSDSPDVLLILVPRHPERFDAVERLIAQRSIPYVKLSEHDSVPKDCQVVLVDQMGMLNDAYRVANIAFVGGSLADKGGHNALEPAAKSVPVIMGPHTYNNPVICNYLKEQGALQVVTDAAALTAQCAYWLTHPEDAQRAGEAGRRVLDSNRGALEKTMTLINRVVDGACTD